jgi:hypothetical protein
MSFRPFLGANVNAASVDELHFRSLIEADETILAVFDGVLIDENRRRIGGVSLCDFVALTDQRLITWARGLISDVVDGFPWNDVDVVQSETWDPWHGRVVMAFRLPAVAPRTRRVPLKNAPSTGSKEQLVVNTLDYMPADDVAMLAQQIAWIGDKVIAGVKGAELFESFSEAFPAVERQPMKPFFAAPDPLPPLALATSEPEPEPEPVAPPKRRWWQFGKSDTPKVELDDGAASGNLVSAYEQQRGGVSAPVNSNPPTMQPTGMPSAGPLSTIPEQPSLYEVSRSLHMAVEAPRRIFRRMRYAGHRAGQMLGGATELMQGMQDPRVRKNTMRGLYYAAAQQEAQNGPLARVGPVVRAAVRFAETPEEESTETNTSQRRIQVRSSVRQPQSAAPKSKPAAASASAKPEVTIRKQPTIKVGDTDDAADTTDATDPAGNEQRSLRRSISIRKAHSANPSSEPAEEAPSAKARTPVRRIAVDRSEEPVTAPIGYTNGNGVAPATDEAE